MSMLVYRVEDSNGVGPYRNWMSIGVFLKYKHAKLTERTPTPTEDGMSVFDDAYCSGSTNDYRFGFDSIEALKNWFDDEDRVKLSDDCFMCSVFEIDDDRVIMGAKQLAFDLLKAEKINSLDLINFDSTQVRDNVNMNNVIDTAVFLW